ncbi:MAG: hypothetical protein ABEL76_07315 [Bradymonadaceae bacterium]
MAEGDERATGLVEDSRSNVEEASILVASGRADSEQLCAALESEGA